MQESRPTGWWSNNWKWAAPVGCLGLLAVSAIFFIGIVSLVMTLIKSSDPYRDAIAAARQDPRVIAELGEPIRQGFFVMGNIQVEGDSGSADLSIPIAGPGGSATVYVVAAKRAGQWNFSVLEVELKGRSGRIDLLGGDQDRSGLGWSASPDRLAAVQE